MVEKVKDVFSFPTAPEPSFSRNLVKWNRAQRLGEETTGWLTSSFDGIAVSPNENEHLTVGGETSLPSLRLQEHSTPNPFSRSRVAQVVRDFRSLYRRGLNANMRLLPNHDPNTIQAIRALNLPSIAEDTSGTNSLSSSDGDVGCYEPDLSVVFQTTCNGEDYRVASSVWEVKCSKPTATPTQTLKNIDLFKQGMCQESLYLLGNHEICGGDLGGFIYDMKFLRLKVIPDSGKTLIAFDVAESFLAEGTGAELAPRFLLPQQVLDGSLMAHMPHCFDRDQPGRQVLWESFSVAARRFEEYDMRQPPRRLNIQNHPSGTADALLEAWSASPDVIHCINNSDHDEHDSDAFEVGVGGSITHADSDEPMILISSEKNAMMWLIADRLDQYPSVDRGDSLDRVKSFVTNLISKRDQLQDESSFNSDWSNSADLSTEDMIKVLVALGVGFVAVSPSTMDRLVEESHVVMPKKS